MGLANEINGRDGKVEVPGLGAVAGLIQRWTLERHAEDGPAGPVWTLRASFSYQNDILLKNKTIKKRIELAFDSKITYLAEALDGQEFEMIGNSLSIKGVRVWAK